jgi:hypothetical protein
MAYDDYSIWHKEKRTILYGHLHEIFSHKAGIFRTLHVREMQSLAGRPVRGARSPFETLADSLLQ